MDALPHLTLTSVSGTAVNVSHTAGIKLTSTYDTSRDVYLIWDEAGNQYTVARHALMGRLPLTITPDVPEWSTCLT